MAIPESNIFELIYLMQFLGIKSISLESKSSQDEIENPRDWDQAVVTEKYGAVTIVQF